MFEKSYSGKCRWIQVFSAIWRSKDWSITLVKSVEQVYAVLNVVKLKKTIPLLNGPLATFVTDRRLFLGQTSPHKFGLRFTRAHQRF